MKITILGAGLTGVTTAYLLAERGHEVTVIERESGSALETSFANGGQLSYSHAEPWATPGVIPKIFKWLGRKDSPLVINPSLSPDMWIWCLKFLLNCTPAKTRYNTENTLRLALYSKKVFQEVRSRENIDFNFLANGILHIFKDNKSLDKAAEQAKFQNKILNCPFEIYGKQQVIIKEPALVNTSQKIVGAVYFPLDESGDIHLFTRKLAAKSQAIGAGVTYYYNHNITEIISEGNKITGVRANNDIFKSDIFIICLGSYTPLLLKKIGIKIPIYPMKGYSISIPCEGAKGAPKVSITDQSKKIVYSRLGDLVRVAGTAEFSGYNDIIREDRIEQMKKAAQELLPLAGDYNKISKWACLRPQTPQGTPLLGKAKFDNLYLNTGHGTLGWTLGPGSAKIVADMVDGIKPEIDLKGLLVN